MQPARRFSKLTLRERQLQGGSQQQYHFRRRVSVRLLGRGDSRCVGSISGRVSGAGIVANVAGAGFKARLDLRTQGERQSVTIRPQAGTDVAAVSIALRKG